MTPGGAVLVTGASRGLGLGLVRTWAEAGRRVFALARDPGRAIELEQLVDSHPDQVVPIACDVADDGSVESARAAVAEVTRALDVVVNNAGIGGDGDRIDDLELDEVRRVLETNTLGPLRVSRAFLPLLRGGSQPTHLVHITSLMGSIEDNASGGSYPYRLSKSALNMASRNLAHELRSAGVVSAVFHPGWVRTAMGGRGAPTTVEEAAGALVRTIEALTMEESGGFYDREGRRLPW